jgi:hypothetical protein
LAIFHRLCIDRYATPEHVGTIICPSSQELAFCDVSGTLFFRHALTLVKVADDIASTIDFLIQSLPHGAEPPIDRIATCTTPIIASPVGIKVANIGCGIEVLPVWCLISILIIETLVCSVYYSISHVVCAPNKVGTYTVGWLGV